MIFILSQRTGNLPKQLRELKPHIWCKQIVAHGRDERSSNKASKRAYCLVKHLNNKQTDPKISFVLTWVTDRVHSIWGCWFIHPFRNSDIETRRSSITYKTYLRKLNFSYLLF